MSLNQVEVEIENLQKELMECSNNRKTEIEKEIKELEKSYKHLSPYDHVYLARKKTRPNSKRLYSSSFLMILSNFMVIAFIKMMVQLWVELACLANNLLPLLDI